MGDGRDEAAGGAAQEQKAEHGGHLPWISQPHSHPLLLARGHADPTEPPRSAATSPTSLSLSSMGSLSHTTGGIQVIYRCEAF